MARNALLMSLVKMAACKPNDESLASSIALSSEWYAAMATTGPNTSIEHTFMSGLALAMTVGRKTPPSSTDPPVKTLAPAASASATHETTRSVSLCEMRADTSGDAVSGSPTTNVLTWSTNAAVKSSAIELCTKIRCVEMQLCPAWLNPATLILAAAVFQSPSGSMMTG